jgi:hypothetical protein
MGRARESFLKNLSDNSTAPLLLSSPRFTRFTPFTPFGLT